MDIKKAVVVIGLFSGMSMTAAAMPSGLKQQKFIFSPQQWTTVVGARFWLSSGNDGAPSPLLNRPPISPSLASRLIFENLDGYSGEVFARADHNNGWFVKGFLGAGTIVSGKLYDEDFPGGFVYSRTVSDSSGYLSYLDFDLGHQLIKNSNESFGAFVGYNYYGQHITTTGCVQLAGSNICAPDQIASNYPGITQDDRYDSLRLGVTTQFNLTNRLRIVAESAYIPVVGYNGEDNHNARQLIGPETSSTGDGVMLEAILKYQITNDWDIGVGGRYWAWNMRDAITDFDFLNIPGPTVLEEPSRFTMERFGVFAQANYHFDNAVSMKDAMLPHGNWHGFSFGGYLGGGAGNDSWSDPFGATNIGGFTNVAGFGDSTHATGPLGGMQVDYNWQRKSWVYGLGGDLLVANIRGENTCFSGLGGVNCERQVKSIGAVTGRIGYVLERSLLYVRGGGARVNTTYGINGNTSALTLGQEDTPLHKWGYTLGIGVEHELNDKWNTFLEYDFIEVPSTVARFPSISTINTATINVRQSLNLLKVGVKFKV